MSAPTAASANPNPNPPSFWKKVRLVIKVVELRLRFIVLMAITGSVFAYWDTLVNLYEKYTRPANTLAAAASDHEHFCPMHPQVVQEQPGSCPICGMSLSRRLKGEKTELPEGVTARVAIDSRRIEQAGIAVAEVDYAPLAQTLTVVGDVRFDERRLATIPSKVPGKSRVERLLVNVTGQEVRAGEPMAELYSPELAQAIQELVLASRRAEVAVAPTSEAGRALMAERRELARLSGEKLKRWGITADQIDSIRRGGKAEATVTILAPTGGTVVRKNVVQGQEITEGFPMFEIADLSHVWIEARVPEHQAGLVRSDQAIEAAVEAYPGEAFPGEVRLIQPTIDPTTRTIEVRFDVANPDRRLLPGMFATVTLKAPVIDSPAFREVRVQRARLARLVGTVEYQKLCPVTGLKLGSMGDPIDMDVEGNRIWICCEGCRTKLNKTPQTYLARIAPPPTDRVLSVPESAVIDTGQRKIVYVEASPGVFEGREVVLGPPTGGRYPVIDGLTPGERVAAAGSFLIDAETRINPGATGQTTP